MLKMFEKDGVQIITLIPTSEEEKKLFEDAKKIIDKSMEVTIENKSDSTEETKITEEIVKKEEIKSDVEFEQLLLDLS